MPSSQESIRVARVRNIATGAGAEETEPIASHPSIEPVPPWTRNPAQDCGKRPGKTQALRHPDGGFRLEPSDAILDQEVGFIILRIESVVDIESVADRRLRRQQPIGRAA